MREQAAIKYQHKAEGTQTTGLKDKGATYNSSSQGKGRISLFFLAYMEGQFLPDYIVKIYSITKCIFNNVLFFLDDST